MGNLIEETKMARGNVSQKDIAKVLGVGQATVSYALKGSKQVSAETRKKVLDVCRRFNYRPNAHAISLRKSDSDLIGLVVSPLTNPYHALLTQYLGEELRREGYSLMVRFAWGGREQQRDQVLELLDKRTAGVLVTSFHAELGEDVWDVIHRSMPLVIVGGFATEGFSSVSVSSFKGGEMAAEHLIDIGRKKLGVIVQPDYEKSGVNSRMCGFLETVRKHGLCEPVMLETKSPGEQEAGYEIGQRIFEKGMDVDGVFAFSDSYAVGLVAALKSFGVSVPQDIAVVGHDDIPAAKYAAVPLTTIRLPIRLYAKKAVEMILGQIKGGFKSALNEEVEQELIVRSSTDGSWSFDKESGDLKY